MDELRYTLLTDGSSDAVLIEHLNWLIGQHSSCAIFPAWADLSRVRQRPRDLARRVALAMDLYPCDVLFVHRDAEREPRQNRVREIYAALGSIPVATVCVVPIRMQEAWLLFDEVAIRRAAGNPLGRAPLALPRLAQLESIPDPKTVLHEALRVASGLSGRRLKGFSPHRSAHLIGSYVRDFAPLRSLSAFHALEEEITNLLARLDAMP